MTSKAWLGLGGNIDDVQAAMAMALRNLNADKSVAVLTVSPVYKTPPWGVEDQPWFLNCCACVETELTPGQLLGLCQEQERLGKRERVQRWGPRTIDIDILIYDGVEQEDADLTLPHPRMLERAFVLVPLADIAPQLAIAKRTVGEWADLVDKTGLKKMPVGNDGEDWWR